MITRHRCRLDPGFSNNALQDCHHVLSLKRTAGNDRHRGPHLLINHVEKADMPAASGYIRLKVEAEHMHRILNGHTLLLPGARTATTALL